MGRAALILVLGFGITFGSIKSNLNKQATTVVETYAADYERVMRRNVKNSAANVALRKVLENINWRGDSLSSDPQVAYNQLFPWRQDSETQGIQLGVRVHVVDAETDTTLPSITALRIWSVSEYDDVRDTTVVLVDRTSFSKYAYFTDLEGNIRFASSDTLKGPVHTNDVFRIQGGATFFGLVSSVADDYIKEGTGDPNFLGGTNFGRPAMPMPGVDDLEYLKDSAAATGHFYDTGGDHLYLSFLTDGTYQWEIRQDTVVVSSGTRTLGYETVIATGSDQDIHVQGAVNGRVTVYSGGHTWIDDDIVYADDARDGVSDDMLGLMAYKSVTVTDNDANNDGHVWIDATIGSMTTELPLGADGYYGSYEKCFHVENFDDRMVGDRGELHVYGGIVQRERGAVGMGGATGTGFDKDYEYDTRFLKQRPPDYPVMRENLIISWWE